MTTGMFIFVDINRVAESLRICACAQCTVTEARPGLLARLGSRQRRSDIRVIVNDNIFPVKNVWGDERACCSKTKRDSERICN